MFRFYTTLKRPKTSGLPMFSGGIEIVNSRKMGL